MHKFNNIDSAIEAYLETIRLARSEHTFVTYHNALNNFRTCLDKNNIDVENETVESIDADMIALYANYLKKYAATTEQL